MIPVGCRTEFGVLLRLERRRFRLGRATSVAQGRAAEQNVARAAHRLVR